MPSRSSASPPPSAPPAKRQRTKDELDQQPVASSSTQPIAGPSSLLDYRNKAFLAPMVRSGTSEPLCRFCAVQDELLTLVLAFFLQCLLFVRPSP